MKPIEVKTSPVPVPCGRCPLCRARRVSAWSFRLMQEERISSSALFTTLTYSTDHVPICRSGMTVRKRDVQLFIKRFRKLHGSSHRPIRYYCAAEYGGKSWRPHYHLILFNARVELIDQAWGLGSTFTGTVTGASVGYTLKYISKPKRVPRYKGDEREPEFSLMSKRLGLSYMTKQMIDWHLADPANRMYVNVGDGKKASMPRYFKEKLFTKEQREMAVAAFTEKRVREAELVYDTWIKDPVAYVRAREQAIEAAYSKMSLETKKII